MKDMTSSVGVFTTDRDLIVQVWDRALAEFTGISPEAACRRHLTTVIPDLDVRGLMKYFRRVLAEGVVEVLAPAFHKYLIRCAPRTPSKRFDVMRQRIIIAPLEAEGNISGLIVTVEDVTARYDRERDVIERLAARAEMPPDGAETVPVESWLIALRDDSWRVRRTAVEENSRNAAPDAVAALLLSVRDNHHNLGLLNSALKVLALSNVDTHATLVEFLESPDDDLRIQAALALGVQKDPRAIPALMKALRDKSVNVVYHAIEALGSLRALEACEALVSIAETRDFFLGFPALDALGDIGDSRFATRIVPLLQDETLRDPAAHALAKIGDESIVEALAGLLNTPDAPIEAAAEALAVLRERYEQLYGEGRHITDLCRTFITATGTRNLADTVIRSGPETLRPLVTVLGWLKSGAGTRALIRHLGSADLRNEIIDAFVEHGAEATEMLLEQLGSDDLEIRRSAIIAIGRIRDSRAVPILTHMLPAAGDLTIEVIAALASIGDASAVQPLFALIGNSDPAIRRATVSALNTLASPEIMKLVRPLLDDPNPAKREAAVRIAGYFGYSSCIEGVFLRCKDADPSVRRAAIEHIPYLNDPRTPAVLIHALREDAPMVRAAAAAAMAHVESPDTVTALVDVLGDYDPWVRYFATKTLGKLKALPAAAALRRLADRDRLQHVRIAAFEGLLRIDEESAVSVANSFLASTNLDLQQAVASLSGQLKHPSALSLLTGSMRSPHVTVRIAAATSLGEMANPDAVDLLRRAARLDEDPSMMKAAIVALGKLQTPEATTTLIDLLNDPTRREMAAAALVRMKNINVVLMGGSLRHPSPSVRLALIGILERAKWSQSSDLLRVALNDSEHSVRTAAAGALARNKHTISSTRSGYPSGTYAV
jgi:HEAT repeat protein